MASWCLSTTAAATTNISGATSASTMNSYLPVSSRLRIVSLDSTLIPPFTLRCHRRSVLPPAGSCNLTTVCMAPEEEKMTRRSPLDFPIEWDRPKPGRRPDIFPQFSPMKTPLPTPLPADPPEEDEEEEEKKEEEEEEDPEKEEPEKPEKESRMRFRIW